MANSTFNADYQKLVEMMRDARDRSPYTQVQLARLLGTTQKIISNCECCNRRMDMVEFIEYTEAIGVDPVQLLADFLEQRIRGLHPKFRRTAKDDED